jgi:protein disulfide-isomerase
MFKTSRAVLVCALCVVCGIWLSGCGSQAEKESATGGKETGTKAAEAKTPPADAKPADAKTASAEAKPADKKAAPAEAKPAEKKTQPAETKPADAKATAKEEAASTVLKPADKKAGQAEETPAVVEGGLFLTDFEAAKAKAKAEKKLLLVCFTGSDWNRPSIELKREVFAKEIFETEAPKQFVCVELDFPRRKELPPELKEQNAKLLEQYKVEGCPTVIIMDAEGEVIARTGYRSAGAEAYLKQLGEFVKTYENVAAIRPQLEKAAGVERAKLLDQLVEAYDKLGNEGEDVAKWSEEIVALDGDGAAGLKPKYEFRVLTTEASKLMHEEKFEEAKAAFEKALAVSSSSITPEQRQEVGIAQAEALFRLNDFAGLVACLTKAQEAAPDSPKAAQLTPMIEQFKDIAATQEALTKIKADLEKAEGIERAKLLDQLIDAEEKLMGSPASGTTAEELAKLSQEVIAIDADNKAGLKQKHEIRIVLSDVMKLFKEEKTAEAGELIDKALATPDLKPEQLQELHCVRGNCYIRTGDIQKGLESLKKAMDAAPEGRLVPVITDMIRFCQQQAGKATAEPEQPAVQELKVKPANPEPAK